MSAKVLLSDSAMGILAANDVWCCNKYRQVLATLDKIAAEAWDRRDFETWSDLQTAKLAIEYRLLERRISVAHACAPWFEVAA